MKSIKKIIFISFVLYHTIVPAQQTITIPKGAFVTNVTISSATEQNKEFDDIQYLLNSINAGKAVNGTIKEKKTQSFDSYSYQTYYLTTFPLPNDFAAITKTMNQPKYLSYAYIQTPTLKSASQTIPLTSNNISIQGPPPPQPQTINLDREITYIDIYNESEAQLFSNAAHLYAAINSGQTVTGTVQSDNSLTLSWKGGNARVQLMHTPLVLAYRINNQPTYAGTISATPGTQITIQSSYSNKATPINIKIPQGQGIGNIQLDGQNFTNETKLCDYLNFGTYIATGTISNNQLTLQIEGTPFATAQFKGSLTSHTLSYSTYTPGSSTPTKKTFSVQNGTSITIQGSSPQQVSIEIPYGETVTHFSINGFSIPTSIANGSGYISTSNNLIINNSNKSFGNIIPKTISYTTSVTKTKSTPQKITYGTQILIEDEPTQINISIPENSLIYNIWLEEDGATTDTTFTNINKLISYIQQGGNSHTVTAEIIPNSSTLTLSSQDGSITATATLQSASSFDGSKIFYQYYNSTGIQTMSIPLNIQSERYYTLSINQPFVPQHRTSPSSDGTNVYLNNQGLSQISWQVPFSDQNIENYQPWQTEMTTIQNVLSSGSAIYVNCNTEPSTQDTPGPICNFLSSDTNHLTNYGTNSLVWPNLKNSNYRGTTLSLYFNNMKTAIYKTHVPGTSDGTATGTAGGATTFYIFPGLQPS
ncbi:hypothetical protein HYV11_01970 [Candidatus Dependentiae bacterium]|nr:hypothetical protein [Candidatus Dependentiae bacterium]